MIVYEIEFLLAEVLVGMMIGTALAGGILFVTLLSLVSGEFVWWVGATTIKIWRKLT